MDHDEVTRQGFLGTGLAGGVLAAAGCETASRIRRAPRMLPTVGPAAG